LRVKLSSEGERDGVRGQTKSERFFDEISARRI
jgi:hypothetical protein